MLQLTLLTFPTAASPGLQIQQSDYLHKYGAAVVQSICSNLFLSVTIYDEAFTVWRMMENSVWTAAIVIFLSAALLDLQPELFDPLTKHEVCFFCLSVTNNTAYKHILLKTHASVHSKVIITKGRTLREHLFAQFRYTTCTSCNTI